MTKRKDWFVSFVEATLRTKTFIPSDARAHVVDKHGDLQLYLINGETFIFENVRTTLFKQKFVFLSIRLQHNACTFKSKVNIILYRL